MPQGLAQSCAALDPGTSTTRRPSEPRLDRSSMFQSLSTVSLKRFLRSSVELVCTLMADVLQETDLPVEKIRHAAVTVPGLVERPSGICMLAPNLGWRNVPVAALFGDRLGLPTSVSNSTQASAYAEARRGAARNVRSFVWVYVGFGVGSAIVQGGQLMTGARGFAGEIGHCRVADQGPLCHCGKRGCLETFTSAKAIVDAAVEAGLAATSGSQEVVAVEAIVAAALSMAASSA